MECERKIEDEIKEWRQLVQIYFTVCTLLISYSQSKITQEIILKIILMLLIPILTYYTLLPKINEKTDLTIINFNARVVATVFSFMVAICIYLQGDSSSEINIIGRLAVFIMVYTLLTLFISPSLTFSTKEAKADNTETMSNKIANFFLNKIANLHPNLDIFTYIINLLIFCYLLYIVLEPIFAQL